ncbi:MAG: hypothetical protein JRJ79_16605 [Deltaproteobacteria bacterium]|nr:hypothetical protein [Deltaproteobacteria bacterium]
MAVLELAVDLRVDFLGCAPAKSACLNLFFDNKDCIKSSLCPLIRAGIKFGNNRHGE